MRWDDRLGRNMPTAQTALNPYPETLGPFLASTQGLQQPYSPPEVRHADSLPADF